MRVVGALDIGGSKILAGLVSHDGKVISTRRAALLDRHPSKVIEQAAGLLQAMLAEHDGTLQGIGCSIPGPLDRRSGTITLSPNLGWKRVPFGAMLRSRLRVPVALDDDARCAAIGEWWRGAGKGVQHLLYVIVGTGVGGGLVINGRVVRGASDAAGEIGHTLVMPAGPRCACGKRGCLEAVASGTAIARQARGTAAEHVVAAALRGDLGARRILDRAGMYLGRVIANAVTLLNPEAVLIGGGVGRGARRLWIPQIRRIVREVTLAPSAKRVRIGAGTLGELAGIIGACWTSLHGTGAIMSRGSSAKEV